LRDVLIVCFKGYLQYFNLPSQGRIGAYTLVYWPLNSNLLIDAPEFGHLRTRFLSEETSIMDYYMYVHLTLPVSNLVAESC
jgi:hypothetical protein